MKVVLGLGCDRNTSLLTLQTAVSQALEAANISMSEVSAVATIDKKNDEHCMLQLVEDYGWSIHFFSAQALSEVTVPNPSAVVLKYMGTPAVSEAAALLAAKTTMNDLILEKYKFLGDDGKNATVSIAITRVSE
jgi:cobalt-precorrin 5A hydrolase